MWLGKSLWARAIIGTRIPARAPLPARRSLKLGYCLLVGLLRGIGSYRLLLFSRLLALFLLLAAGAGFWLWRAWPQVLLQSAVWQRALNVELSRLLQAVAENPAAAGLSLLGFSFAYGILHALGPGHGKVVITTWLATHPSKLKSSIGLTLAASLLQGLVAIALVVVVLTLLRLPARQLHLSSFWLEKGSYLLVGALGLLLCWRALKKLRMLLRRPTFTAFTAHHVHHASCGCGHQHAFARPQARAVG